MNISKTTRCALALGVLTAASGVLIRTAAGPPGTDWTIDNGGKAIVVQELAQNEGQPWLRYPAAKIDPELRFFPQPLEGEERYALVRNGRVHSQYDSPFTRISFAAAKIAGDFGLSFLPALGGGVAVFLTSLQGTAAGLLLLLATPLLFYSSVFWEHTWVTALAAGALLLLTRPSPRRALAAGIVLGLAILLREELVLLYGATLAAFALSRRSIREILAFGIGGGLGVAGLGLFHFSVTGSITGAHLAANRPVPFAHALDAAQGLLFSPGLSKIPVAIPVFAFALLMASRVIRFRGRQAVEIAALALLAIPSALALARYPSGEDQALALIHSNSILVAMPWALPALAGGPGEDERLPFWASVIFLLLFIALVPARSITGIHPGPRMLLPIVPVLAIAAWRRARRDLRSKEIFARARLIFFFIFFGIGLAWSARSIAVLGEKRQTLGRIADAVADDPRRVVVTDLFWLPTELHSLWNEKQFHLVGGPSDLRELQRRYAAAGETELLFVTTTGSIRNREPLRIVKSEGFPHFSVELHALRP